ncbi:hypothetical protein ACFLU6_07020, partial [Acidobacteriota bacterium]
MSTNPEHLKSRVCVVDCGSSRIPDLCSILTGLGSRITTVPLERANSHSFQDDQGIVISGGPLLFTDEGGKEVLTAKFDFIKAVRLPILGICLGHQAMGLQYGAEIFLGEERRSVDRIDIITPHPLVDGIEPGMAFAEDHREGITLPKGFQRIGSSGHYNVEIMASRSKPLYGVQFHPEISGAPGNTIFRNFLDLVRIHAD